MAQRVRLRAPSADADALAGRDRGRGGRGRRPSTTPTLGVRAARRGLHVLVEKPIAVEPRGGRPADRGRRGAPAACSRSGTSSSTTRPSRSCSAHAGGPAPPRFVEVQRLAVFTPRSLDVDVILDLMIHDLQILHALDPSPVAEVRATGIRVLSTASTSPTRGSSSSRAASPTSPRRGSRRSGCASCAPSCPAATTRSTTRRRRSRATGWRRRATARAIAPADLPVERAEPLRRELEALRRRLPRRRRPIVDGVQGRQALATALAVGAAIEASLRRSPDSEVDAQSTMQVPAREVRHDGSSHRCDRRQRPLRDGRAGRSTRSGGSSTPFGDPSDAYVLGELEGRKVAFLPRHGRGHRLLPTELNYRANIYGFKMLGVEFLISVSAVGSMKLEYEPGHIVVPDQFFDRTRHRPDTFFGNGLVAHVSLAEPICPRLAGVLAASAARRAAPRCTAAAPTSTWRGRSSRPAPSREIYRQWGVDVIGMTNLQEAKLAREAEICYASLVDGHRLRLLARGRRRRSPARAVMEVLRKNVAHGAGGRAASGAVARRAGARRLRRRARACR